MEIKRFEDILVWQEARSLVNIIYDLTSKHDLRRDFGLKDQLERAAVSSMSNVAEGFGTQTNKEFIQYLVYTRRSCAEVESQLYIAVDRKYISRNEFNQAYEQAKKVAMLANGFIRYLRTNNRNLLSEQTNKRTNELTN